MNALFLGGPEWWQIAGWTMFHFLWLGAVAGAFGAVAALVLRRAPANVRYVAALASLALLAALPIGIAAWLVSTGPATPAAAIAEGGAASVEGSGVERQGAGSDGGGALIHGSDLPSQTDRGRVIELSGRDPAEWSDVSPLGKVTTFDAKLPADWARVTEVAVGHLPWLWIVGTPLTFALLASGLVGTRRLRSASRIIDGGPIVDACARIARSLGIGRRVTVAICERIAAPVLVGIVRPAILLPPAALMGWSPSEVEMVLLHELAHVRRWDNLVNLLQRLVESLLFFHPAVWLVSNWVRREREACCDAIVVGRTHQPQAYAEMLVAIAARMPRSALFAPAVASAMAAGPLRSRIRQILKLEDDSMLVSGKSLVLATLVLLVVVPISAMQLAVGSKAEESAAQIAPQVADQLTQTEERTATADAKVSELPRALSDAEENALWQALFKVNDDNPLQTKTYDVPESLRQRNKLRHFLEGLQHDRFGPRLRFDAQWSADSTQVEIRAPQAAHETFFAYFAVWDVVDKAQAQSAALPTDLPPERRAEIELLTRQIADLSKKMAELHTKMVQGRADYAAALEEALLQRQHQSTPENRKQMLTKLYQIQFAFQRQQFEALTNELQEQKVKLAAITGSTIEPKPNGAEPAQAERERAPRGGRTLAEAVREFNAAAKEDAIGAAQLPLTEDEVIAAIRGWARDVNLVSDETYTAFEKIADTRMLPPDAKLDFTTGWELSTQRIDVWWVDLTLKTGETNIYTHRIRDVKLRSRPLTKEEIAANAQIIRKPFVEAELAEWEKLTSHPSRMDARIALIAWELHGLKVIFVDDLDNQPMDRERLELAKAGRDVRAVKLVGGDLPESVPLPSKLISIDGIATKYYCQLLDWIKLSKRGSFECVAIDPQGRTHKFQSRPQTSRGRAQTDPAAASEEQSAARLDAKDGQLVLSAPDEKTLHQLDAALRQGWQAAEANQKQSRFPSLEQQKLADIAWRALNVELEPIAADDLRRVQALGYEGGLMVAGLPGGGNHGPFQHRDILVGLHVWATRSLEDVARVLSRHDLAELLPLKFYVIRSRGGAFVDQDAVVPGRASISADRIPSKSPPPSNAPRPEESAEKGANEKFFDAPTLFAPRSEKPRLPSDVEQKADLKRASLRFEGKSFDEWRDAFRLELSPDRRREAVNGLTAFAASGYGKEAAQAILEVAKLYDWTSIDTNTSVGMLKSAMAQALGGRVDGTPFIAWNDWLPLMVADARSGDASTTQFAVQVFGHFLQYQKSSAETNIEIIPPLLELSRDDALKRLRGPILGVLAEFYVRTRDEQIAKRMEELLAADANEIHTALNALYDGPYQLYMREFHSGRGRMGAADVHAPPFDAAYRPQLVKLLRHDDFSVRLGAVRALAFLGEKAAPALPHLLPLSVATATEEGNAYMDLRSTVQSITGSDQALVAYWRKVIAEKSLPPAKVEVAKTQLENWEQEQRQQSEERTRFERPRGGREEGRDPAQADPRSSGREPSRGP